MMQLILACKINIRPKTGFVVNESVSKIVRVDTRGLLAYLYMNI
jgi:hypothetical protein